MKNAVFKLIVSSQKSLDKRGFVDSILMDLSEAYGCLPYNFLLTKLKA